MGQVWQATDTQLNREVALQILPGAFAADPDRLARFTREAQILASFNHPDIALDDIGNTQGHLAGGRVFDTEQRRPTPSVN